MTYTESVQFFQYRVERLAGKNISKITYFLSSWDIKPCSICLSLDRHLCTASDSALVVVFLWNHCIIFLLNHVNIVHCMKLVEIRRQLTIGGMHQKTVCRPGFPLPMGELAGNVPSQKCSPIPPPPMSMHWHHCWPACNAFSLSFCSAAVTVNVVLQVPECTMPLRNCTDLWPVIYAAAKDQLLQQYYDQ